MGTLAAMGPDRVSGQWIHQPEQNSSIECGWVDTHQELRSMAEMPLITLLLEVSANTRQWIIGRTLVAVRR